MRLVTFRKDGGPARVGALTDDKVVDLTAADPAFPNSMRALLAAGAQGLRSAQAAAQKSDQTFAVADVELLAPVPDPQKVICIGLNYKDHAEESGAKIPGEPVVFNKFPTAVTGTESAIQLPKVSEQVDYEAELVIVVGREGKNIPAEDAFAYVAGYTVGHDVSARDWQIHKDGKQWLLGKSFDTFAPMGPALVTKDEVPDPHQLNVKFTLNGQVMQDSTTAQMIFRVDELIAYVSQVCTLTPGDVIFTGTPPGVGFARTPPIFLQPGDVCEVEIQGLGVLRNQCVAE